MLQEHTNGAADPVTTHVDPAELEAALHPTLADELATLRDEVRSQGRTIDPPPRPSPFFAFFALITARATLIGGAPKRRPNPPAHVPPRAAPPAGPAGPAAPAA